FLPHEQADIAALAGPMLLAADGSSRGNRFVHHVTPSSLRVMPREAGHPVTTPSLHAALLDCPLSLAMTKYGSSSRLRLAAGTPKHAALRGIDLDRDLIADLEVLQRMGLYAQHRAGGQARVILADIAEEDMIGDLGPGARTCTRGGREAHVLGTNRHLHAVARHQAVKCGDIHRQLARKLD